MFIQPTCLDKITDMEHGFLKGVNPPPSTHTH